jgi:hypothetical protein
VRSLVIVILFLAALAVRLWGMAQGYPDFYGHVDEIGVAASVWNFFRAATLQPTEFTYPALYPYLMAFGIWATAALGLLELPAGGALIERIAFVSHTDPGWSALVGRTISAFASAGVVLLLYRLGRQIDGAKLGWTAAIFSAFALVPMRHAHHALPDSLTSLLGAAVVSAAWQISQRDDWRSYLWAGMFTGLLLATKFNGAFCAFSVVAAHAWRVGLAPNLLGFRLWGAGLIALTTSLLASPYLLWSYENYLHVAQYQVSSLDFSLRQTSPWWWIPRQLATEELVLGGWMLAGIVLAMVRRQTFDLIALAALVPAGLYIGSWTRESLHYLLPYYPGLLLLGASACTTLSRRLAQGTVRRVVTISLLALTVTPNLWRALAEAESLRLPDTRKLAADWIRTNVPAGSTLAMTWLPYGPRLDLIQVRTGLLNYYATQPAWQEALGMHWASEPAYRMVNLEVWLTEPVVPASLQDLVDLDDPETRRIFSRGWRSGKRLHADGVEFLVLPAAVYERYMGDGDPPEAPAALFRYQLNRAYFTNLLGAAGSDLVARIPNAGQSVRGSQIDIYRLR